MGRLLGAATSFFTLRDPLLTGGRAAFNQLTDLSWDVGRSLDQLPVSGETVTADHSPSGRRRTRTQSGSSR